MRILITGGTGMIGNRLVATLAEAGHEVIVLSRSPQKYTFPDGARGEEWDAQTSAGWGHLADGADAIINLAGENIAGDGLFPDRWTAEKKRRIHESRIMAGQAVTEAIEQAAQKPRVLLQSSGVDYYGDTGDQPVTEDSPAGNTFLAQVCVDWEASTAPAEAMGVRRVVLRTGVVFSMEGGALPITVLPFRLFAGGPLGNGRQWMPWIHIDDVVATMVYLLENESAAGPINLVTPNPVQNKELANAIGEVLKRPSFIPAPAAAMRLALGETADLVLHSHRVLPEKLQALNYPFRYTDVRVALRDLL